MFSVLNICALASLLRHHGHDDRTHTLTLWVYSARYTVQTLRAHRHTEPPQGHRSSTTLANKVP